VGDLKDVPRTPIASNCSGKHTGMLALALHHGWRRGGYQQADHPVQRRCREEVARWAGLSVDEVGVAVDGCGVSCFAMPLERMASAFARLGTSDEPAAQIVVAAMTKHPDLVAGRGRLCTELMRAYSGRILAKIGAEGVYGVALLERGLGIALKVEDGDSWSSMIALLAVLEALGVQPSPATSLPDFAEIPIRNTRGEPTGALRIAGSLTFD
jgi:L-asparaginase II